MKHKLLWITFVLFYGLGDMLTTFVGLEYYGLMESNPHAQTLLAEIGYSGMAFGKILVFTYTALFLKLVRYADHKYGWYIYYISLGTMAFVGLYATANNAVLIYGQAGT